ncbi:ethanolamine ammonia-lyase reactivating factor EutA [Clostridium manihotivorum]|uniref:Ethanolamine utilization protein EutA n=1 Tax=Clostridium manihotivorum TaxID=2320868 RepID=A0A410DTG5_9CLOT|nr:ethanolamine ammonia-lyase reactivating factor EutA [Clostridium manihotivorum]QAA32365.1 ethanolamine utilization protein EutA [Clostridium manihotivorum]
MENVIYSIGVDIGTSTTEIILSKLKLKNIIGASLVQETIIESKEVIYKSPIEFTPLLDTVTIDFEKIKVMVEEAIKQSGVEKNSISTGAVIITGETARKENAREVSEKLSEYLGSFVVATAGPKLEALLAGQGAGASELSKKLNKKVINLDIGGGTTNVAVFNCGSCEETFALDIGGRLIRFDHEGKVIYISERIEFLLKLMNLDIKLGEQISLLELKALCLKLVQCLLEASCLSELTKETKRLFITEEPKVFTADVISFSGGVAEYIGTSIEVTRFEDLAIYKDIGPLLGICISEAFNKYKDKIILPKERIRATVIGAGNHSLTISGSTIAFDKSILPIKNIPIIKPFTAEENINKIFSQGKKQLSLYENTTVAFSLIGPKSPSYKELKVISEEIIKLYKEIDGPIIVILENDFAKALGQIVSLMLKDKRQIICLDKISTKNGDYIDIGLPIGNAIPVVIKTLVYKDVALQSLDSK